MHAAFNPPPGYNSLSPFLMVNDLQGFLNFVTEVFHTQIKKTIQNADGSPKSAEVWFGESLLMCSSANGGFGPFETMQHVYVTDVDACLARALALGSVTVMPASEQFYGDYAAGIKGPHGNYWWIARRTHDMTDAEIQAASLEREG